jgi:hypothetical protein
MRTRMPVVLLCSGFATALMGGARVGAQSDGSVTVQMANGMTMVQHIQGNRVRVDIAAQSGMPGDMSMIMDGSTGTQTMMMHSQKMYTQSTGEHMAAMVDSMQKKEGPSQLSVTQGGTEVVAGVPCTDYTINGVGANGQPGQLQVCAASSGVGMFTPNTLGPRNPLSRVWGSNPQAAAVLAQFKGKAILKVSESQNGAPMKLLMQVTKIDASKPADTLFVIPAGYTKLQMPAGMGGAMPGGVPGTARPQ